MIDNFNACIKSIIFLSVVCIRYSDLQNTKIKTVHTKKNVGHQFQFPQQYIKY